MIAGFRLPIADLFAPLKTNRQLAIGNRQCSTSSSGSSPDVRERAHQRVPAPSLVFAETDLAELPGSRSTEVSIGHAIPLRPAETLAPDPGQTPAQTQFLPSPRQ